VCRVKKRTRSLKISCVCSNQPWNLKGAQMEDDTATQDEWEVRLTIDVMTLRGNRPVLAKTKARR
jgi:hypothetical protein